MRHELLHWFIISPHHKYCPPEIVRENTFVGEIVKFSFVKYRLCSVSQPLPDGQYVTRSQFLSTDADYADDIAILANASAQAETLLYSLERAATGICLHVNAHKMEYMCFNQTGDISTLGGSSLKLIDKFPYQGSSVSSTEKDIDTRLTKAWTAIGHMEVRPDR